MRRIGGAVACLLLCSHCTNEGCPTGFIPTSTMCVPVSDAGTDAPASDAATSDTPTFDVPPDATRCGARLECMGSCVDQATDRENCGACGVRCGFLEECTAGSCNQPVALLQGPARDTITAIASAASVHCIAGNTEGASTWRRDTREVSLTSPPASALVECAGADGTPTTTIRSSLTSTPPSGDEGIRDLAVTSDAVYVAGAGRGFFQIADNVQINEADGLDGFVARVNLDGSVDRVTTLRGSGDSAVETVATNETGTTVCYGGWYEPGTILEGVSAIPADGRDAFVTCTRTPNTFTHYFGAAGADAVTGIVVGTNYVYVVGTLSGTVAEISGETLPYLTAGVGGGSDAFLLRISLMNGQPDFGIVWGSAGDDAATDIAVDAAHIAITGHCAGPISLGALTGCGANQDGFLIVLDAATPTPTPLSGQLVASPFADSLESVALGAELFVTGYISGAASIETLRIAHAGPDGTRDVLVARAMTNGRPLEAFSWGAANDESGTAIDVAMGVVRVGGQFVGEARIAGTPFMSLGNTDGFLVQR